MIRQIDNVVQNRQKNFSAISNLEEETSLTQQNIWLLVLSTYPEHSMQPQIRLPNKPVNDFKKDRICKRYRQPSKRIGLVVRWAKERYSRESLSHTL